VRDAARMNRRTSSAGSPITGNQVRQYTRGSVAKAISVRTSKLATRAGDVGVFVNVRPIKKGAGRSNPNDPFYWRFLEFGTKFMAARPFLEPAAARLTDALAKFEEVLGPQIQRLDTNPKDPL
jgi:HK97 gp10 family phage protein